MMDKMLIKIPLQFFGEPADDGEDDFDEAFEEDDEAFEEDEEAFDEEDEDVDEEEDEGKGNDTAGAGGSEKGSDDHSDLIADLKALGFKGDDLDSIKASVKARREAREKGDAAEERRAAQAAGKSHIKGSKPARGASGEEMEGFTARDIAEVNASLRNPTRGGKGRARAALERAIRASSK